MVFKNANLDRQTGAIVSSHYILLLTLLPMHPYAAKHSATDHAAANPSAALGGLQLAKSSGHRIDIHTRWDIYEIIFGTLLLWRTAENKLFEFGEKGFERLKEFIKPHAALPAGQFADALIRQLFGWSGKPSEEALDDGITLVIADYQHA